MISSHRITWRKELIPDCKEMMKPYYSEIWPLYFRIFNETTHRQRLIFFSEPLIKHLWEKFRVTKGAEIQGYLRKVQIEQEPSQRYQEFIRDI